VSEARTPLFCDTALAARIEQAEAQLVSTASQAAHRRTAGMDRRTAETSHRPAGKGFVTAIAGGVASFAEDESPFNKVAGLGFGGVPSASELTEVERSFAACGAPVQVELSILADPKIGALLTGRGYRLISFENVLGRALTGEIERVTLPETQIRRSTDGEYEAWLAMMADADLHPDTQGVPWHEEFPAEIIVNATRDLVAAAGVLRYAAVRDGVIAGGATIRMTGGIAQFTGASTAPAYRRRGIQTALTACRLADAAAAGCDLAVVVTQPGSKSQQNVQRQGFDLLYTRAILVKQP
jgi:ribosomal protein S18 acetylase RimI-like enzyme